MCGDRDLKKIIDQSQSSEWLVKELKLSYIVSKLFFCFYLDFLHGVLTF